MQNKDYAWRCSKKESVWWKKIFDVQAPYRWNIRRLRPGFTLDIGCGLGRNLVHLGGNGVGIDANEHSLAIARSKNLKVFSPEEFKKSPWNKSECFDSILLSHVLEHMNLGEAEKLIREHLYLLKTGGKLIVIAPQECGFKTDPTHVEYMDFDKIYFLFEKLRITKVQSYSFPFPREVGKFFPYNEFVVVGIP